MLTGAVDMRETALRWITAPYARGAAALDLTLAPAISGVCEVAPYDFAVTRTRFGLQANDIAATYVLTLLRDALEAPSIVEIDFFGVGGPGTVSLVVPAGSLAGAQFVVAPLPNDPELFLTRIRERPVPGPTDASGPDKWGLTALLGHAARLLFVLTSELQTIAATARDVKAQINLATARGGMLDRIGQDLGVPRLPPAPYRLDFDADTVALYHFDDAVAPVLDATHDYPGASLGATRGVAGKFGGGCRIQAGGVVIGDADAFTIDPTRGFTVELYVNFAAPPGAAERAIFAIKRPRADPAGQPDSAGWSLSLDPVGAGHDLVFALSDSQGGNVKATAANFGPPAPGVWTHLAATVNPTTHTAAIFVNGAKVAEAPLGGLGEVVTGANIGLGSDSTGAPRFNGTIDEVRFSNVARADFSSMFGPNARPYAPDAATISLYHFDETDDWIDEDSGAHFALNVGSKAQRDAAGRFGRGLRFSGDPLPPPRCAAEREFQAALRKGAWDRSAGGAPVGGPYARFGYRQGAIRVAGVDKALHPVFVNDQPAIDASARGLMTSACYGFTPDDPTNTNNPGQTIAGFLAVGRSVREAIDYFGEWRGLNAAFFKAQYLAHGVAETYEPCLPPPFAPGAAQIPASTDFAFDAAASFTVEAFVQPDAVADAYVRVIVASRASALLPGEVNAGEAGWALTLGPYHSIANNLRFTVGDAARSLVTVTADRDLADGAFHHIAGVVDRAVGVARLYIDGVEARQAPLRSLGAASGPGPIAIGDSLRSSAPYSGVIDELRISRVARAQFHPALGESDARYRQRLAIYRPRRLPTARTVQTVTQTLTCADADPAMATHLLLTDAAPPDDRIQFEVDETDSTRFCASQWFRVIPPALAAGDSIASDGTRPAAEPSTLGLKPLPPDHPALVTVPDGPQFSFADGSGGGRMILAAAQCLERLGARLAVLSAVLKLGVESAYVAPPPTPAGQPPVGVTRARAGGPGTNEIQTLAAATAASEAGFTLLVEGRPSPPLPFAATAGDVQAALEKLLGADAVACAGGPLPARSIAVSFQGSLGYAPQPLLSVAASAPATNDTLGRALTLTLAAGPPGFDIGALGALAFAIGADYAARDGSNRLRIVVVPGQDLDLAVSAANNSGRDPKNRQIAVVGQPITVSIKRPAPKTIAGVPPQIEWSLLPCGRAAGRLKPVDGDPTQVVFTGDAFGVATIAVRYALPDGVTTLFGSLPLLIAPQTLDGCDTLGGDGAADVAEAAYSGAPDNDFRPEYLVSASDPRLDFAVGTSKQMQLPLEKALLQLVGVAAKEVGAPRLTLLSAFDPSATNLQAVGRGLVLAPGASAVLSPARLAALAFIAGFSYVERRRYPPSVYVSVPPGDRFEIVSSPLKRLWANARISGAGAYMANEFDAAGPPDAPFNPAVLQAFIDPRADFGAASNKVQPGLAAALTALLDALAADGIAGPLKVLAGFTAGDPSLLGVGRALLLRHPAVPADRLAGYALQAAFGFVRHDAAASGGAAVYVAAYSAPGAPISVLAPPGNGNGVDVAMNALTRLAIRPALAVKGTLEWAVEPACPAAAALSSAPTDPADPPGVSEKILQGTAPGALAAVATFSLQDFSAPYQFRILSAATARQTPRISKDQYDDLMNFLDAYRPVGSEAVTRQIRQFVHGFKRPPRWDRLPTEATYQHYKSNR